MENSKRTHTTRKHLEKQLEELRYQLEEANETIEAIRTGQIDALVVQGGDGHQLYTLKSADQTYRMFIEKMTEGAVTLNPAGIILYCNSQFATMVRMPLSAVIGMPFENFIAPHFIGQYHQLFQQCWRNDCKGELVLIAGDDGTPVQLSLTTLQLDEGVSLSIILTDLTEIKATQKQLEENYKQLEESNLALEASNYDLQQFASVASHDLQEPLRKIQIFSNLLKEKHTDLTPQSLKYLDKIINSSERMKTLILDILQYSRLSVNQNQTDCVDLGALVAELLEDFELIIEEKHAEFNITELPCVLGNRGQIKQVFQNIIGNALKFSKRGVPPVITISYKGLSEAAFDSKEEENGPFAQISIADNGIGFEEKYIANVFSLFERLNSKDQYEGTGIGLAIAKKIIDKHNGLITAISQEGKGAEFKIILQTNAITP